MILNLFNVLATNKYKNLYRVVKDEIVNGHESIFLLIAFL